MSKQYKENALVSILFSIVIPAIILSKFSNDNYLGVLYGFLIALSFPILYSIYQIIKERKVGFIAILGLVSIFFTGIIGVLELPTEYLAYKEASVPLLIGAAILISMKTPYPLFKKLFYNPDIFDTQKIENILTQENKTNDFNKAINNASYMLAASFLISTILNFTFTKLIVTSPAGTEAFNEELGKLTAISYPAIALPSSIVMFVALWYLIGRIKKITNLSFEDCLNEALKEKVK